MLKLTLDIDNIDYDSLIDLYLPQMVEHLRRSDNPVALLLSNGMPAAMAKMIIKKLPDEAKDKLAADLINANQDAIKKIMLEAAQKQNLQLDIAGLSATAEK